MKSPKTAIQGPRAQVNARFGGVAICRVINPDGSIAYETKPTKNLVMYPGITTMINGSRNFNGMMTYCRAGTGTTPNSESRDGTFSRTGTTVSRSTGTGVFSAADVGRVIKFGSGEEAYITGFTSSTEVEVRESGSIVATSIVVWDTARTDLENYVLQTTTLDGGPGANATTVDNGAGSVSYKRTYNFPVEVAPISYTEVGVSNNSQVSTPLFARIVLGTAVNVGIGQQLQVEYTLTAIAGAFLNTTSIDPTITGWPYPYNITNITHSGSAFDVTLDQDHHYQAGDEITIALALPVKFDISSISSTVSEFTVTTTDPHGLTATDSIEIEDCSVGAYNGTWTVAAVDSPTVFRVTSGANPGAAADGTVRQSTPGTWYDGTWTIDSVPTSSSIRITDASSIIDAGEGDLEGTLAGDARLGGPAAFYNGNSNSAQGGVNEPISLTYFRLRGYREGQQPTLPGLGVASGGSNVQATRDDNRTPDLANHSVTYDGTFDVDELNFDDIRGIKFDDGFSNAGELQIQFDQNQRKDSGYTLKLGYTVTLRPTLA